MDRYVDDFTALRIRNWDWRNARSLFKYLKNRWPKSIIPDSWRGDPLTDTRLVLQTTERSGNEELVEALRSNRACWKMFWRSSERLGSGITRHVFEIPEWMTAEVPRTSEQIAAAESSGAFLPRLDNRMLRFLAMLAEQGADAISSRICEDMLPEAEAIWSDAEKLEIMTRYEQWNSNGEQEPEWTPQGGFLLAWLAANLMLWADQGKALEPVDEGTA